MLNTIYTQTKLEAATRWLHLGAALLPVQPGTKFLVRGYGLNQSKLTTLADIRNWYGSNAARWNLAVCLPDDLVCLDFDSDDVYQAWEDSIPSGKLLMTYQETTRRGWHLFYRCKAHGLKTIPGLEVKRVVLVAPSSLPGFVYSPAGAYPILQPERVQDILPASFLLSVGPTQPAAAQPARLAGVGVGGDVVSKIKACFGLVAEVSKIESTMLKPGAGGRWWHGFCPWHDDKENKSLWVDSGRGVWGCYACQSKGDVINWYALANNIEVSEAIKRLAKELPGGEVKR